MGRLEGIEEKVAILPGYLWGLVRLCRQLDRQGYGNVRAPERQVPQNVRTPGTFSSRVAIPFRCYDADPIDSFRET